MAWEKQTLAKIKWRIAVLALLSCGGALSVSTTQAAEPSAVSVNNKMLPASDINWSKYAGKVVVIDFWASWCGPCRESFPWMKQMQAKYGKDGLVFLGINVDKYPAYTDTQAKQHAPQSSIPINQLTPVQLAACELLDITPEQLDRPSLTLAYRRKMADFHPDQYQQLPPAVRQLIEQQAQQINQARSCLEALLASF